MRRIAAVSLVPIALWLSGCAGITQTTGAGSGNSCEAKVVRAMISPNKPVAGAYACFDRTDNAFALALASQSIKDDASLAAYAGTDPVYTTAKVCPNRPASAPKENHYYELGGLAGTQAMLVHVTPKGKVDAVNFGGTGSTCASIPE